MQPIRESFSSIFSRRLCPTPGISKTNVAQLDRRGVAKLFRFPVIPLTGRYLSEHEYSPSIVPVENRLKAIRPGSPQRKTLRDLHASRRKKDFAVCARDNTTFVPDRVFLLPCLLEVGLRWHCRKLKAFPLSPEPLRRRRSW